MGVKKQTYCSRCIHELFHARGSKELRLRWVHLDGSLRNQPSLIHSFFRDRTEIVGFNLREGYNLQAVSSYRSLSLARGRRVDSSIRSAGQCQRENQFLTDEQ
jgi:hypothetical protein